MPDGRHHDPHIEGELIRAGLCEEVPLKEHAGPFAELNNRTGHAFGPEGKMRRGIEYDGVEVCDMADLVRTLGAGVLAGHDIAAQVDGDGVRAVHPAFLAKGLDGSPPLDRGIKFVDALSEAKGIGILDQSFEDRACEAVQLGRLEASRPDSSCGIIDIHHALEPDEDAGPTFSANQALRARRS
jgi:hypothetical protein